jgi:hypothetical protein
VVVYICWKYVMAGWAAVGVGKLSSFSGAERAFSRAIDSR